MNDEQRSLWDRVIELWDMAVRKDVDAIRAALHPRYLGWERGSPRPHDRDFAVNSVTASRAQVTHYDLQPLGVEVYDGRVGVAHYVYMATVVDSSGAARVISGRWTEVHLKEGPQWLMISVQGGPEAEAAATGKA